MIDNRTKIYKRAYKMLSETNIYDKPIEKIGFGRDDSRITLIGILKQNIKIYTDTINLNNNFAYDFIVEAMEDYLSKYPASYSFKQRVKIKFGSWLKSIRDRYSISGCEEPEWTIQRVNDIGVSMLKALHPREGITKDGLVDKLKCDHTRTVQKYLRRISDDAFEEDGTDNNDEQYNPFYIGEQPIHSKIKTIKKKGDRKRYFYTPNTVHPIVLQANLMQVGALLTALYHNYNNHESNISSFIAIDIWSQLSDYAKRRIKLHYALNNNGFNEFLQILEDECPDEHACDFKTERDMYVDEEMYPVEQLLFLSKSENRTCRIILKNNQDQIYTNQRVTAFSNDTLDFTTTDQERIEHQFNYFDVDIEIE